jgi:hypothetical protein
MWKIVYSKLVYTVSLLYGLIIMLNGGKQFCIFSRIGSLFTVVHVEWGTAVTQWLRYCATYQKVADSIPDGFMEFFIDINPFYRTMAPGSNQPLIEMSTGGISWRKCGQCVRLTNLPPFCAVVKKSGNLNFLEPSGPPQACNGTALPLHIE